MPAVWAAAAPTVSADVTTVLAEMAFPEHCEYADVYPAVVQGAALACPEIATSPTEAATGMANLKIERIGCPHVD